MNQEEIIDLCRNLDVRLTEQMQAKCGPGCSLSACDRDNTRDFSPLRHDKTIENVTSFFCFRSVGPQTSTATVTLDVKLSDDEVDRIISMFASRYKRIRGLHSKVVILDEVQDPEPNIPIAVEPETPVATATGDVTSTEPATQPQAE